MLEKLSVPPTMISIIESFHEDLSAKVVIGQEPMAIDVCNELRQGYFTPGVRFRYKHGRTIMDDRTAKSKLFFNVIT